MGVAIEGSVDASMVEVPSSVELEGPSSGGILWVIDIVGVEIGDSVLDGACCVLVYLIPEVDVVGGGGECVITGTEKDVEGSSGKEQMNGMPHEKDGVVKVSVH